MRPKWISVWSAKRIDLWRESEVRRTNWALRYVPSASLMLSLRYPMGSTVKIGER